MLTIINTRKLHQKHIQVVCRNRVASAWKRRARGHSRNGPWTLSHLHTQIGKQKSYFKHTYIQIWRGVHEYKRGGKCVYIFKYTYKWSREMKMQMADKKRYMIKTMYTSMYRDTLIERTPLPRGQWRKQLLRIFGPKLIRIFELITIARSAILSVFVFLRRQPQIFENVTLVARRKEHLRGFWASFLVAELPPKTGVLVHKN